MDPTSKANSHLEVLAERASRGDDRSFDEIYKAISGKMYSLCLRYAGNSEDAKDFFQEGFVKLFRHLSSFRAAGSFEGWARQIFVSTCIDGIKKRNILLPAVPEGIDMPGEDFSGFDKLANQDLIALIRQLPDGYRTVVNLYMVEGYNHKEIADMLSISEEGSRSQLFRARILLKKLLTKL